MSAVASPTALAHDARELAALMLADRPERWRHTIGVARRAEELVATVDSSHDADLLVAAAWLHDIGYAAALHDTGFHPLDGARYLDRCRWPIRVAALVANHSGALTVARVRGLADLMAPYPHEQSPVSDALIYADQTVGPNGQTMTPEHRLAEVLSRHGPGSPQAVAHPERAPILLAAIHRVEQRLLEVAAR